MNLRTIDYAKLDWKRRHHHERFVHRVLTQKPRLICQECCGAGGEIEPVTDDGQGPFEECGWCEGTGFVTPWLRGLWLAEKRRAMR